MKLNLTFNKTEVELTGPGGPVNYELREMTAAARDAYLDAVNDRLKVDANGKPIGIKKWDGMHAELLTKTLFQVAGGKAVTREVVQEWPAATVTELYNEAQRINGLHTKATDEEPKK